MNHVGTAVLSSRSGQVLRHDHLEQRLRSRSNAVGPDERDPQLGLNLIYIPTLIIFVVLQVPTALSVNFGMLLAFRFLTGFFASPVLANGGASISHMFSARKRAQPLIVWAGTGPCGPVLGK